MPVTFAKSCAELQPITGAWDDLVQNAVERNVFYEPWMFLPALEMLREGQDVSVALVWSGNQRLIGFFPFVRSRGYRGVSIHYLGLWRYPQCFLCTPLLRAGCEEACFNEFFNWVDAELGGDLMVQINYVRGDGPFYEKLTGFLKRSRRPIDEVSFQRALLQSSLDGNAYIKSALSNKSRREFERQGRRLAELGEVEIRFLEDGEDLDYWIEWLLRLEVSGWKGRAGTALAVKESEKRYFEDITRAAYARGQLLMEMLLLNARPIAIRCTFLSGSDSYGLKIAYDEDYAKYSPGVQLEFTVIRRVLSNPRIAWMDSCAEPEHPMFNRLWKERRLIRHVNISTGRICSRVFVGALAIARRCYYAYGRLRKRKAVVKEMPC